MGRIFNQLKIIIPTVASDCGGLAFYCIISSLANVHTLLCVPLLVYALLIWETARFVKGAYHPKARYHMLNTVVCVS